jgi:hypothetical protein
MAYKVTHYEIKPSSDVPSFGDWIELLPLDYLKDYSSIDPNCLNTSPAQVVAEFLYNDEIIDDKGENLINNILDHSFITSDDKLTTTTIFTYTDRRSSELIPALQGFVWNSETKVKVIAEIDAILAVPEVMNNPNKAIKDLDPNMPNRVPKTVEWLPNAFYYLRQKYCETYNIDNSLTVCEEI